MIHKDANGKRVFKVSGAVHWSTPQAFYNVLDREFHFTLDAAANEFNAKCPNYFTQEMDALKQKWTGRVFCNPPYGPDVDKWLQHGMRAAFSKQAEVVVFLLPGFFELAWAQELVFHVAELRFVRGRLNFELISGESDTQPGRKLVESTAPFSSMVAIYEHGRSPIITIMDRDTGIVGRPVLAMPVAERRAMRKGWSD